MGKKIKKTTEKTKLEAIDTEHISVVMSNDEVNSVIQILDFAKELFRKMSNDCLDKGDEKSSKIYSSRSLLSEILYNKFKDLEYIGEPTSRELH